MHKSTSGREIIQKKKFMNKANFSSQNQLSFQSGLVLNKYVEEEKEPYD